MTRGGFLLRSQKLGAMPETVPVGSVPWCGDLPRCGKVSPVGWEHGGSISVLGSVTLGSHQPPWQRGRRGGLVIGVTCCSRLEGFPGGFLLPAPSLASSEHVPFYFPSAWRHRLRVPHLHPAGGHDISEVGGTGGAQRPHHAVRGMSWVAAAPAGDPRGHGRVPPGGMQWWWGVDLGQLLLSVGGMKGGCGIIAAPKPCVRSMDPASRVCPCWGVLLSGSPVSSSNGFSDEPPLLIYP